MRRTGMSSRLHSPRYNRLQRSTALVVLALSLALFGRSVPAGAQIPGALNISLTASPARAAVGDTVSFDLSASPPSVRDARLTSVVLDFGDGASSALRGPFDAGEQVSRTRDHRYSAPGDYTATVTATASNGDSNSATQ